METNTNEKKAKIEESLKEIMRQLGHDNSELATEKFAQQLLDAATSTMEDVEESNEGGLGLNCIPVITNYLYEMV